MDNKPGLFFYFTVSHEHVYRLHKQQDWLKNKLLKRFFPSIGTSPNLCPIICKVASPWRKFQQPTAIQSARVTFCSKLLWKSPILPISERILSWIGYYATFRYLIFMARKLCVRNYSSSVQEPKNSVKIFVFKLLLFKRQFHNVSWMNWNKQVEGSEWSGRDGNFLRDLELLRSLSSRLTPVTQPTPRPTYCVEEAAPLRPCRQVPADAMPRQYETSRTTHLHH